MKSATSSNTSEAVDDDGLAVTVSPVITLAASVLPEKVPLPAGYRQGIITAITVFIGFSLSFLRYWAFEASGSWTLQSIAALIIMLVPICGQINALYRALLIADDDEATYIVTTKWFIWSIFGMLFAVCFAAVVISDNY